MIDGKESRQAVLVVYRQTFYTPIGEL